VGRRPRDQRRAGSVSDRSPPNANRSLPPGALRSLTLPARQCPHWHP
jgi:hypothetical protein